MKYILLALFSVSILNLKATTKEQKLITFKRNIKISILTLSLIYITLIGIMIYMTFHSFKHKKLIIDEGEEYNIISMYNCIATFVIFSTLYIIFVTLKTIDFLTNDKALNKIIECEKSDSLYWVFRHISIVFNENDIIRLILLNNL